MVWSQTRNNVIARALRICGAVSQGQTPSNEQYSYGADALQAIIENLHNEGYRGSQIEKATIPCVAGTVSYSAAANTLEVIMAYITVSGDDEEPLSFLTEKEYYGGIEDKTEQGLPEYIYVENKETPTMYLYYVPDYAYTLNYIRIKKSTSIDTSAMSIDLEKRWWEAITYKLAEDLADEYNIDETKAKRLYAKSTALVNQAKKMEFYRLKGNTICQGAYTT